MERVLEVCCGNIASVKAARETGAYRVELCKDLPLDGLTPDYVMMRDAMSADGPRVNVLIRPVDGGFVYDSTMFETMLRQIRSAASIGASGVVIGALTPKGDIDIHGCAPLVELAKASGLTVTFHRAFDRCADPDKGLRDIIALGCDRVLTSGQAITAVEGIPVLRALNEKYGDRIIIMPGGGVNLSNACRILDETGCREIHGSCRTAGDVSDPSLIRAIMQSIE